MRVLFVTHYSSMYGANKSLFQLILEMKSKKVDIVVLCPVYGEFVEKLKKENIEVIVSKYYLWMYEKNIINKIKMTLKVALNKIFLRKIVAKLQSYRIDIIHTNSSVINIGAELSKIIKSKHIWHIREFGEEDYNMFYHLGYNKSGKYFEENSDKIIAISSAIKNKYKAYINPNKIKIIYNGITTDIINEVHDKRDVIGKVEFVLIGLLHENKNQLEAIKAVKVLKEKYQKKDFVLNIVGNGSIEYISKMKKYTYDNKLEDHIKYWGYQENISNILSKMNVGLMTSKNEAFGRVTVEMMLNSIPVIGTATGGTLEIIDEKSGFLYSPGDVEKLAFYMNKFLEDKKLILEKGEGSKQRALKNFTSKQNAENIYKLYLEVMDK